MERRRAITLAAKGLGFGTVAYGVTNWFEDKVYGLMGSKEVQQGLERPTTYRPHPSFILNEIPVNITGVAHHSAVLLDNWDDLERQTKNAQLVVVEYFDKKIRDMALPGFKDTLNTEVKSHNQETDLFFAGIGSLCAENQTDIVTVNPETYNNQRMEMYMMSGLPVATIALDLVENSVENTVEKVLGIKLARANALKGFGLFAGGITWLSWIQIFQQVRANEHNSEIPEYRFAWNEVDFRDAKAADNLDSLTQSMHVQKTTDTEGKKGIAVFQGSAHEYLKYYIDNPSERIIKLATYPHHLALSKSMNRWHFDQDQQQWVQQA